MMDPMAGQTSIFSQKGGRVSTVLSDLHGEGDGWVLCTLQPNCKLVHSDVLHCLGLTFLDVLCSVCLCTQKIRYKDPDSSLAWSHVSCKPDATCSGPLFVHQILL